MVILREVHKQGFSTLKYKEEVMAVIPDECVGNVLSGLEKMFEYGALSSDMKYSDGYTDGVKDTIEDFKQLVELFFKNNKSELNKNKERVSVELHDLNRTAKQDHGYMYSNDFVDLDEP